MAFILKNVVPWGRTFGEYLCMFSLNAEDMKKKIASFGDGPASFNYEATLNGYDVTSFDPIYNFSKSEIAQRIEETRAVVMKQMSENIDNYNWNSIKDLNDLEKTRLGAMNRFLNDYEKGKTQGRYIATELPEKIDFEDKVFDIGLSSHFLLMYKELGYDFHIAAINEMLRLCREIRIAPITDLDGRNTELTNRIIKYYSNKYNVKIIETDYNFLKNGNRMMVITGR